MLPLRQSACHLFIIFFSTFFVMGCSTPPPQTSPTSTHKRAPKEISVKLVIEDSGHVSTINDLIVVDANHILTASSDKTIKLWDINKSRVIRSFLGQMGAGHYGDITAIALDPNRKFLLSASNIDGNIRVYDFQTGDLLTILTHHHGVINDLSFSPDGHYLISSSQDRTAIIWDVTKNFSFYSKLKYFTHPVSSARIYKSDDDYIAMVVSDTGLLVMYSLQKRDDIQAIAGIKRIIHPSLAISKKYIALTGRNSVLIFDKQLQLVRRVQKMQGGTPSVNFSKSGSKLIIGSDKPPFLANVYDVDHNFKLISRFQRPFHFSRHVDFLDENSAVATGGDLHDIWIWDIKTLAIKAHLKGQGSVINSVSMDDQNIAFGSTVYTAKKNPLSKQELSRRVKRFLYQFFSKHTYYGMKITPDYIDVMLHNISRTNFIKYANLIVKNYNDYGPLEKQFSLKDFKISLLDSNSSFKKMPTTYQNYSLKPYKNREYRYINKLVNEQEIFSLEIYKDGSKFSQINFCKRCPMFNSFGFYRGFILIATDGGNILVYDLKSNLVAKLVGHSDAITSLGIYKDTLISGSKDKQMKLWDLKTLPQEVDYNRAFVKKYIKKNPTFTFESTINRAKEVGFIGVFRPKVISPLVSIYTDDNNESVIWTPEGYFSVSSLKALKSISWHMNQGLEYKAIRYDIGKFYDLFFRPDLVKLKLQGIDIAPFTHGLTAQDALKNPPPQIKITRVNSTLVKSDSSVEVSMVTTDKDHAHLHYNIHDFGGGIGSIRIYQEGKLIQTIGSKKIHKLIANADEKSLQEKAESSLLSQQKLALSKAITGKSLVFKEQIHEIKIDDTTLNSAGDYDFEVSLKAGNNYISIEAFNHTNTITSFRSTVNIMANIPKKRAKLYAIVAGVNTFNSHYINNLQYSVNDAKAMKALILKGKEALYEDVEVIYLTDAEVTKTSVLNAFNTIEKKANIEDSVIFYISTHGRSAKGKFYLIPSTSKKVSDLITFSDIFKKSQQIKALEQIYIIDACESGGANDIASAVYDSRASVLSRSSGIHLLSASTSGTKAFESDTYQHSNFTYSILQALSTQKSDENRDGYISIIEASKAIKAQKSLQEKQYPVIQNIGKDIKIIKL